MPGVAWHAGLSKSIDHPLDPNTTQATRRGLYATMSYVDDCVGKVLAELEALDLAESTVVSFIGDHGQQAGEHNLCKQTVAR